MPGENSRVNAREDARRMLGERVFLATVTASSGGLIAIQRQGQAEPDAQFYPAAAGLAAAVSAGDLVMCLVVGGRVVVAFEVVTS
ncbi:MAG: hypothetical protein EPO65_08955 [Dehalococcoidia bacterium]|nr:MAG: hypothetical protein EPO65_08955 [Dehalococcoidia bacterium]